MNSKNAIYIIEKLFFSLDSPNVLGWINFILNFNLVLDYFSHCCLTYIVLLKLYLKTIVHCLFKADGLPKTCF